MQLTHAFLSKPMPAIGTGGQAPVKMFYVGMPCNQAYGGGKIESMTYERSVNALVIRKDVPFVVRGSGAIKDAQFDHVDIPWEHIEYAYGVGDVQKQQPQQVQAKAK